MGGFDIYHSFKALPWASLPTLLARRGDKLILDLDDWETGSLLDQGKRIQATFMKVFENTLPKRFAGVVVVSEWLKRMCIKLGVPEERVLKLPNGCDADTFRPMQRDPQLARELNVEGKTVIYVGSIGGENLVVLVRAIRLLIQEVEDAVLLALPGWDPNNFKQRCVELGLPQEKVIALGRQPHEKMPRILSLADVVYMPNRFVEVDEARSPSRLGEYMAAGKPIVADAVGTVKEQLSDGAGILVYSPDPKELAEKILEILQDSKLAERLGRKAREKAERVYSWKILARHLRDFYFYITSNA
jgi:glycosyltransferase involved in cell wall biosynthesis